MTDVDHAYYYAVLDGQRMPVFEDKPELGVYRWRASKIAPKEYGDRLEVDGKGVLPLVIVRDLTGRKDEPEDD